MEDRVLVVSPRPARPDGRGDQRRTAEILRALSGQYDVTTLSWLPDVGAGDWRAPTSGHRRWAEWVRAAAGAAVLPAQVAYVQSLAPATLARDVEGYDLVVFVTDRAVPRRLLRGPSLVDFIDDLGEQARRRGRAAGGPVGLLWRIEGRRLHRFDRRVARRAQLSVAHSAADAAGIDPGVGVVPLSIAPAGPPETGLPVTGLPGTGHKVVFLGNLFYRPNHEAAIWICRHLAPRMAALGVAPGDIVVAGRRPPPDLVAAAGHAGVDLRADVDDLSTVLAEAAVVLAPMALGVGFLYKILDACGAGRACVLSPLANAGLDLVDGESALIAVREPDAFAQAVVSLLDDPSLRARISANAQAHVAPYQPAQVDATWQRLVRETIEAARVSK